MRELVSLRRATRDSARQRDRISNEPIKDGAREREKEMYREVVPRAREATSLSFDLPSLENAALSALARFLAFPKSPRRDATYIRKYSRDEETDKDTERR